MKTFLFAIFLSFSLSASANNCFVSIDMDSFTHAFGNPGLVNAIKVLDKKGYKIIGDKQYADFELSGYLNTPASVWSMWSPITPRWTLKKREGEDFKPLLSGTISGRVLFDSQKRRARKLKRALRKHVETCQY